MSTCSIPDCEVKVLAHGWRQRHYARWYRYGDPLFLKKVPRPVVDLVCAHCGESFTTKLRNDRDGNRYCGRRCYDDHLRATQWGAGPNNVKWKGGISQLHRQRPHPYTQTARKQVFERDNYTCRRCGITEAESRERYGRGLGWHHIKQYFDGGDDSLENLLTVCCSCHAILDWETDQQKAMVALV